MGKKNTIDFDYKSLTDFGITENQKNQENFISDMLNTNDHNGILMKQSGCKNIQYDRMHDAIMDLNLFGKIVPECDFTLLSIMMESNPFEPKDFDCYYLPISKFDNSENSRFLLIPKDYNSQSKNKITVIEVNSSYGTPISKTEFYFPFVNNVFRLKNMADSVYLYLFQYLLHFAVTCTYRQTKVSKQRDVHPSLSYNKIRL